MIGTHNSMTYLPPKKWYLYPFRFIAKCQSKSIEEQVNKYGIRLFDIRIGYDKNNKPEFRHGCMSYKGDVYEVFKYLNSLNIPIKIRLILEINKGDSLQEVLFMTDCDTFKKEYPNLTFYEGRRKFDWKQLYDFPSLNVPQMISSMTGTKLDDWWPWLYARRMNKKNIKLYSDVEYLLLDFINIQ